MKIKSTKAVIVINKIYRWHHTLTRYYSVSLWNTDFQNSCRNLSI